MRESGNNGFRLLLIFALALPVPMPVRAQAPIVSRDDARKLCDHFLEKVAKGELKKAFGVLKPYITATDKDFQEVIEETERQRALLSRKFGPSKGFELLQEQEIKDTLVKFTFIERYKISVIRWSFIFYKPEDKWILNSFYWDENVRDLFK